MCENEKYLANKIDLLFMEGLAESDKSITKGHKSDLLFCFPPTFPLLFGFWTKNLFENRKVVKKWSKYGHKQKSTGKPVQKLKSNGKLKSTRKEAKN